MGLDVPVTYGKSILTTHAIKDLTYSTAHVNTNTHTHTHIHTHRCPEVNIRQISASPSF